MENQTATSDNKRSSNPSKSSGQTTSQARPPRSLWRLIRSDLERYHVTDKRSYLSLLFLCEGAISGVVYRIGNWMYYYRGRFSLVVRLGYLLYIVIKRLNESFNGISIQPQAQIGEGLYIAHGGSVHIAGKAVVGDNCNISQEVTIGVAGRRDKRGTPKIGDRIYIGAGAKIFGPIEIGDDVAIGANAVVTKSLPDRAVAVGVPARIISCEGSFDFVIYKNMDQDIARQQSLQLRDQPTADFPLA